MVCSRAFHPTVKQTYTMVQSLTEIAFSKIPFDIILEPKENSVVNNLWFVFNEKHREFLNKRFELEDRAADLRNQYIDKYDTAPYDATIGIKARHMRNYYENYIMDLRNEENNYDDENWVLWDWVYTCVVSEPPDNMSRDSFISFLEGMVCRWKRYEVNKFKTTTPFSRAIVHYFTQYVCANLEHYERTLPGAEEMVKLNRLAVEAKKQKEVNEEQIKKYQDLKNQALGFINPYQILDFSSEEELDQDFHPDIDSVPL